MNRPTGDSLAYLKAGNYLSLGTRKRSGDFVDTPVWFAPQGDNLYVFSAGNAGKVKRLKNFSEARVARCTYSGKRLQEWLPARATVMESDEERATALAALREKYGIQMTITDFFARVTGKFRRRAYIRITLNNG